MSVLSGTLELHNVTDVEALVRKVADDRLRSWGCKLKPHDHEDLVSYLIGVAWELSGRYDPARDKKPNFAAYAAKILTLRCADWFRGRFGDTRHGERPVVLSLDAGTSLTGEGDETGAGGDRLVDALASSAGDPAADRAPDLLGVLQRGGGDQARAQQALGQPPPGRAQNGTGSAGALKRKHARVPGTPKPKLEAPVCSSCLKTFLAAFQRANALRAVEDRLDEETLLVQAQARARAVKFADDWHCPRCTTVELANGAMAVFEQLYPNRSARRIAAKQGPKQQQKKRVHA